ncbi:MAG: 4Fe-4S binding protein [Firmicutes bacterium]|nr:4Fe-4S binding protein [Bacillota bacterium]
MPRIINDDCIGCGACAPECPVSCIHEGTPIYKIDEAECIDCGACDPVCPTSAIVAK